MAFVGFAVITLLVGSRGGAVVFAIGFLALTASLTFSYLRERRLNREWLARTIEGVSACGLQPVAKEARVAGRIGRFAVIVSREAREGTAFVVDGLTLTASIRPERASPERAIGDEAFDARYGVEGDRAAALVCLTTEARRALLDARLLFDDLEIEGGRIRARIASKVDPAAVDPLLRSLAALALMLSAGRASAREIAARFASEPLAPVRRQILEAGLAGFEDSAAPLARAALRDGDARIRLRGAEYLGDHPTLTRLVEDPAIDGDVRAAALEIASRALEREDFLALLTRLFAASATRRSEPDALLLALCSWARKTHTRAAQPALLRMLEGSAAVRDAAISGLAAIGDATAVGPLRGLSAGLFTGEVGRAAESAIEAIQARLKGAEPGQISLPEANSAAGALSEPESAGNLSIAKRRGAVPDGSRRG